MKHSKRFLFSTVLLFSLLCGNALPCADSYITPVFKYAHAPENPYENFAAGRLGILQPTYRRVVLYAAYRFLNNQPFASDEQKALVEVWNAEFRNQDLKESDSNEAVKKWLEKRKEVFAEEEYPPSIYVEKSWRGYSFFPNCNTNAFETAAETLQNRIFDYGAEDKNVSEWLKGQDAVFSNCSGGASLPTELAESYPEWLRKDREYQIAAAKFYSMDFADAIKRFEKISVDSDSAWRETAEYLIGRTLVRQAGFTTEEAARKEIYEKAENHLSQMRGNKYLEAAQNLVNLIKLRTRPQERARELAQSILYRQSPERFRQDLIDYTWLLDKFETEILKAEEKRKEDAEIAKYAEIDRALREKITADLAAIGLSVEVISVKGVVRLNGQIPKEKYGAVMVVVSQAKPVKILNDLTLVTQNPDGGVTYEGGNVFEDYSGYSSKQAKEEADAVRRGDLMQINLYGDSFRRVIVKPNATEQEIFDAFENGQSNLSEEEKEDLRKFLEEIKEKGLEINAPKKLTVEDKEKIRKAIKDARAEQIKNKFSGKSQSDYEGGYGGEEKLSLALLPESLRADELTDWLFTFQIQNETAYLHALEKWRQTKSDLWLVTALVKADKNSAEIENLLKSAAQIKPDAAAFPTVAYHTARIFIEQKREAEAAKLLDEILNSNLDLPVSSRNEFAEMRMKIAETLTLFLKNATRKPFTLADYERSVTIDEIIEEQKAWWSEDWKEKSKGEWEKEVEESFAPFRIWEKREMFDAQTVAVINEHFPLSLLLEAQKSPVLPEYLREKLAIVIWTRAVVLDDDGILQKIAPELLKIAPEIVEYQKAKTAQEKRLAALFVVFRHNDFSPYLQSGFLNRGYQTYYESAGWWCSPQRFDYDDGGNKIPMATPPKPAFISDVQTKAAQFEMKKLEKAAAPDFLAEKAIEWLKIAPNDKRLPEVLYHAYEATIPYRDSCSDPLNNEKLAKLLQKHFPDSEFTRKLGS
jgi:hypothetical protein